MVKPYTDVDEWHLARWSRFTCSLNDKLIDSGTKGVFSATGMSYIKQKAVECSTRMQERPELEEVKSLLWGKAHEYPAFEYYVRATNNKELVYCGTEKPLFLEYEPMSDECGGSPDAVNITSSYTVDFGAEIKCPKRSEIHFERLKWKDQWDVKENCRDYYTQIQNILMITGAKVWDFVSYDDRQLSNRCKIKIIPIKEDKKFQDALHFRLGIAVREKYKILSEYLDADIKNRQDFIRFTKS